MHRHANDFRQRGRSLKVVALDRRNRCVTTPALASSTCSDFRTQDKYRAEIAGPGYCALAVVGPVNATNVIDTAQADRPLNMVLFAIATLELLRETMKSTEAKAKS